MGLRNIVHSGFFKKNQDVLRRLYNQRKYESKYISFLKEIQGAPDREIRSIYNRLVSLGKKAMVDMNYITFPYSFVDSYFEGKSVKAYTDEDGFCYVLHKGKRLYGQKSWNEGVLARYYNGIMIEQDKNSAHCYFRVQEYEREGEHIADFGAAEGIFGLEVVEKASRLYLFECDPNWVEPLKRTFAPWKEKVIIVQKYIAKETSQNTVSMDDFFKNKQLDFFKADIEGSECDMLEGGKDTLKHVYQALLCLYHRYSDEDKIINILSKNGFETDINPNYMVFFEGSKPDEFLRHGVVCATNNKILI